MAKRVAVVLSGCGYLDGAEIYEATLALLALDLGGAKVRCFAPSKPQMHVMHHAMQAVLVGEVRNVLTEASRLARRKIEPLDDLRIEDIDAVVFPGGFGVAKNLCDYAIKGVSCSVDPLVEALIRDAHGANKPICAICIAPVMVARVLGEAHHPQLTIGSDAVTAGHIEAMGGRHVESMPTGIVVDEENRIVSTPAYMCDAGIAEVWAGVGKAIEKMLSMA